MAQHVLLAALSAFVGYHEAKKYEREHHRGPLGIPAALGGVACFALGFLGAFILPALVIAALFTRIGYTQTRNLERQYREQVLGVSALMWTAACFVFSFMGALLAPVMLWTAVCVFVALLGALFLLTVENEELTADAARLTAETKALTAEKNKLLAEKDASRAGKASAAPGKSSPRRLVTAWHDDRPSAATPRPPAPAQPAARVDEIDLLPRGGPRTAPPVRQAGNDLLPRRR